MAVSIDQLDALRVLPISIRGDGHSVAGHAVGPGSLMIDLAHMRSVTFDAACRHSGPRHSRGCRP